MNTVWGDQFVGVLVTVTSASPGSKQRAPAGSVAGQAAVPPPPSGKKWKRTPGTATGPFGLGATACTVTVSVPATTPRSLHASPQSVPKPSGKPVKVPERRQNAWGVGEGRQRKHLLPVLVFEHHHASRQVGFRSLGIGEAYARLIIQNGKDDLCRVVQLGSRGGVDRDLTAEEAQVHALVERAALAQLELGDEGIRRILEPEVEHRRHSTLAVQGDPWKVARDETDTGVLGGVGVRIELLAAHVAPDEGLERDVPGAGAEDAPIGRAELAGAQPDIAMRQMPVPCRQVDPESGLCLRFLGRSRQLELEIGGVKLVSHDRVRPAELASELVRSVAATVHIRGQTA
jgi:hypothetical protein